MAAPPVPTETPALQLEGVVKRYGQGLLRAQRRVLEDVALTVAPGTCTGLVGPNGSGKSTLLRLAAGVEPPTAGAVRVFGAAAGARAARRRIGFLPERSPFPPELSARSALSFAGAALGVPRRERAARAATLLARLDLAEHARRPLGSFSQGMLRRFGLAAALFGAPDLLLLDEATAGLDATGFVVFDALVAEALARGAAVLVASHVLAEVTRHADRLAVLVDGRIRRAGPVADFLREDAAVRFEVEGLDRAGWEDIERTVARHGGSVRARGPSAGALRAIYAECERERRGRSDP